MRKAPLCKNEGHSQLLMSDSYPNLASGFTECFLCKVRVTLANVLLAAGGPFRLVVTTYDCVLRRDLGGATGLRFDGDSAGLDVGTVCNGTYKHRYS